MTEENTYHYVYPSGREVFQCRACRMTRSDEWSKNNPEKKKKSDKNWAGNNPLKKQVNRVRWAKDNPGKTKTSRYAWDLRNPEKRAGARSSWEVRNPEYSRIKQHRRRARKRNQMGAWPMPEVEAIRLLWDEQSGKCAYCSETLGSAYHVDHKNPLARGGLHGYENICLACPRCNWEKGLMTDQEYQSSRSTSR
jgi:hypothetical protein